MICFINVLDQFILVIRSKALKFTSSFLFGTYIVLDRSTSVFQLLLHPSEWNING